MSTLPTILNSKELRVETISRAEAILQNFSYAWTEFQELVHAHNIEAGWWNDLETGEDLHNNKHIIGEKLCLVHSEVSEGMEGHRKNLPDDKLPHFPMLTVELGDAVIRIADIGGAKRLDLGEALREKFLFNMGRPDHKIENRLKDDGKKY